MEAHARLRTAAGSNRTRLRLVVCGLVQGVGFRPFVHRQATALGLVGWVGNAPEGVIIEAEGATEHVHSLVATIQHDPPSMSVVTGLQSSRIALRFEQNFAIRPSQSAGIHAAQISPDLATCAECLRELFDPGSRRFRYPFINCTQCGPRYSIIAQMPYDRVRTSMCGFTMCPACRAEYDTPEDRRFHAEPNACAACGPHLTLWTPAGTVLAREDAALCAAAERLRQGGIVAIKGIGGFHLLVDARDEAGVRRLRTAKHRAEKPFAVMFPTLAAVRQDCRLEATEEDLLTSPARPIVLLERAGDSIAPSVAPDNPRRGALLPYSPLHHLLLHELGFPVVATSGNISEEPIVTDEHEALKRLGEIADLFLVHDRPIVRAVEDSVAHIVCHEPQVLRRARGYAPMPVAAGDWPGGILAYGGHLKSTVAMTTTGGLVLSQHLGDLATTAAREAHGTAVRDIVQLHAMHAGLAVCDLHPDYASTQAADASGLPVCRVQHHAAHVAACLAEHGVAPPALGVAWDGTGYGPDGTIWGGEFLHIKPGAWERVAHLRPFRLPGGDAAIREPARAALGLLFAAYGEDAFDMTHLAPVAAFDKPARDVLRAMLGRGVNAPVTTSAGRLFDGFAALCGLRQRGSYEGQAACALEWAATQADGNENYEMPLIAGAQGLIAIDWEPALAAAIAAPRCGQPPGMISAAFHEALAAAITAVALRIGEPRVVLTGGCFQNRRLTEASVARLTAARFSPLWHRRVPPNDGGIAVGQAAWAAWQMPKDGLPCA